MPNDNTASSVGLVSWIMLFALGAVWGTSFILIKYSLVAFSPMQVACLRIGITAICFVPIIFWKISQIEISKWKQLTIVGFIGSFIPAALFAFAQTKISSSLAGILNSLTPLFTLTLGIAIFDVKSTWSKILGVLVGLSGAIYLLLASQGITNLKGIQFGALILIACMFYGTSNNVVKTYLQDTSSLVISAIAYCIAGVPALVILFSSDFVTVMKSDPNAWPALGYVSILALLGTFVCSVMFFKLIKNTSALFASTVSYVIPVVAVLWGVIDGEKIGAAHFIGMAMILAGVYVSKK